MPWLGQTPGPALSITEAKVLPASLNPDGDYVTFAATISSSATWTISIVNGNNGAVKTFSGTGTTVSQRWYGENAQSVKVADGVYYCRLDAYDASSGSSASWPQGLIMVSRLIPIAIIDAPTDNQQFVGGTLINITGTASDSTNFSSYALAYGSGENPASWTSLKTATTPITNGLIHAWNTTTLNNTVYTLRLTVTDSAGNVATETARVRLSWIQNVTASEGYLSPNGDGIKDSTLITASFTEQADWTLTFKNPIGVAIRTYSGTGSSLAQTWDGKDEAGQTVPDGTYTYRIDAMGGVVTKTIVVDTTLPTTLITAPTSSAAVWNIAQVVGTASDANFESYRVEYGPGSGSGPWTLISAGTSSINNGALANWTTTGQTNGNYTIRLFATDKAGNNGIAMVPVTITNLVFSGVGASPKIDTSLSETASIFFTINGPATATLKVIPDKLGPTGSPVFQATQTLSGAGAYLFSWNGLDNAGAFVPDEAYLYLLDATDGIRTAGYNPYAPTGAGSVTCSQDATYNIYRNDPLTISYSAGQSARITVSINVNHDGKIFKIIDSARKVKIFKRPVLHDFLTASYLPPFPLNSPHEATILSRYFPKHISRGDFVDWKRLLAYISGSVDQELLLRNEYLVTENRILRNQLKGRLRLSDGERKTLAELGKRLGKKALDEVANIVRPETILGWHRALIARKFDGSKKTASCGRPRTEAVLEALIVRLAKENRSWGYDRIVGALANLGYIVSDQTVGNILKRHGLAPVPERKKTTTWKEFIRTHRDLLAATDFFTAEVWTAYGLTTYYVLFFIRLSTREIHVAGITPHPNKRWMTQIARNITMEESGFLSPGQSLIHDRDGKFCRSFKKTIEAAGIRSIALPPHSPNLNAYAERWVRSVKEECLSNVILFGEGALRRAIREYVEHYHKERNHQGRENALLLPHPRSGHRREGPLQCRERLGGLLKYYDREAA